LHVAPNNGGSPFFGTLQCEETKGIIHSRIIPTTKALPKEQWRHKTLSYIISALISCNFIIKNYVNRKITSYVYLLIFTKSLWLHVKHVFPLIKRESVRRIFFFVITDQNYPSQHIDQWPGITGESTTTLATKKKKTCVRITRVKSDSYLTYGQ
jgi:hypothetical protein